MSVLSVRWIALGILLLFLFYTVHAARSESFWKSLKKVLALKWGRQVVADLYIGLLIFGFIVYLNEGSTLVAAAWLVPSLVCGNIVPLIYVVFNFSSLTHHFF